MPLSNEQRLFVVVELKSRHILLPRCQNIIEVPALILAWFYLRLRHLLGKPETDPGQQIPHHRLGIH